MVIKQQRVEMLMGQAPTQCAMNKIDDICKRVRKAVLFFFVFSACAFIMT